jgi:hypothetical protein
MFSTKFFCFFVLSLSVIHVHAFPVSIRAPTTTPLASALYASVDLKDLAGSTPPFNNGFDPLRLSTVGSEATLAWFQAAYVLTRTVHGCNYAQVNNQRNTTSYTCFASFLLP